MPGINLDKLVRKLKNKTNLMLFILKQYKTER